MKHFYILLIAAAFTLLNTEQSNAQMRAPGMSDTNFYFKPQLGPNPAQTFIKINWQQSQSGTVIMQLYTPGGLLVATLLNQNYPAGYNAASLSLAGIPRGTYIFRFRTPSNSWSTTLVLQ